LSIFQKKLIKIHLAMPDSMSRLQEFLSILPKHVSGELRCDDLTRVLFSTDASLYQVMPHGVLWPKSTEDIQAAVELAAAYEIPVLARGAGTSLAGQAVNQALIIDVSRHLDRLIEVNPEERWARVQPGMVIDDINLALMSYRLQFGPDPASSNRSTIGGAVANNATGSHSIIYGMTADHVLGMQVVFSDGSMSELSSSTRLSRVANPVLRQLEALVADPANQQIIRDGTPSYWRRCGGYNLDRLLNEDLLNPQSLICGSEGTLAFMTEITINLVPVPRHTGLVLLDFADLYQALAAVPEILKTGPSAVELLDDLSLKLCLGVPEYARLLASVVGGMPHSLLVIEYAGDTDSMVLDGIDRLKQVLKHSRSDVGQTIALTHAQQSAIWQIRRVGLGLLMSIKGDMKPVPFIEDAAVPVEFLPDYVKEIEEYCRGLDTPISYYAHASAGCLHIRPLINTRSAREVGRMPDIARFSAELVKSFGGALSSEHGDGRSRSWLNEMFFGPELYGLFRQVKQICDPRNLFNPGMIVDAPGMGENLRLVPSEHGSARLDFSDYSHGEPVQLRVVNKVYPDTVPATGFVRSIEMCNGAGICLKRQSGTMCPSFMVTRDEMHSTRGRANALRATMTGLLPPEALTGSPLYEVMDLCISCKGCKAECPSAVDMARLKLEFLARYHEVHGVPLRSRLFGNLSVLNRLAAGPIIAVANRIMQNQILRRRLGITTQRPLPRLARQTFESWWRDRNQGRTASQTDGSAGRIVLLIDVFTNYYYPEVGIAAVEFLSAAGWDIAAAPVLDEGRSQISKGLLAAARRASAATLNELESHARARLPIVGLEPSSLLTLRDEYHYLLPGDSRVPIVAGLAQTFEEFVAVQAMDTGLDVEFRAEPKRILLHGHCHQKALVGTAPARAILSLPPGNFVEEVDSGCCGMAGSFGYEAEHYEISMKMAERRLLPAVRQASGDTVIVAAGISCREQIAHGTGRVALHPAEVLRNALAP
jgi:FAD/FMN-containing dehydrogenase/Fe-S oxidoreductase